MYLAFANAPAVCSSTCFYPKQLETQSAFKLFEAGHCRARQRNAIYMAFRWRCDSAGYCMLAWNRMSVNQNITFSRIVVQILLHSVPFLNHRETSTIAHTRWD